MNRGTSSGRGRFGVTSTIQQSIPKAPSAPFGPIDTKQIDEYTIKQLIKSANAQAQSVSYGHFTSATSIKYNNLLIPSIPRK
ncbi:unnamed protein product [Cunninghamella blakesleeana]